MPISASPYAGGGSFAGYTTGSNENGNDEVGTPGTEGLPGAALAAATLAVETETALALGAALAEAAAALAPPVLAGLAIGGVAWAAYQFVQADGEGASSSGVGGTPPPPSPAPDFGQGETLPLPDPQAWGDGVLEHPSQSPAPPGSPPSGSMQPLPPASTELPYPEPVGTADLVMRKDPPVSGAVPGPQTNGRSTIWVKSGGVNEAMKDFVKLHPSNVRTYANGVTVGELSDGRTVVVRPTSSDGRPTLEIQDGKHREKVRYDE